MYTAVAIKNSVKAQFNIAMICKAVKAFCDTLDVDYDTGTLFSRTEALDEAEPGRFLVYYTQQHEELANTSGYLDLGHVFVGDPDNKAEVEKTNG